MLTNIDDIPISEAFEYKICYQCKKIGKNLYTVNNNDAAVYGQCNACRDKQIEEESKRKLKIHFENCEERIKQMKKYLIEN